MEWVVIGVIVAVAVAIAALPLLAAWASISLAISQWKLAKAEQRLAEQRLANCGSVTAGRSSPPA
jgi:thiazole synthase ThiGH ThiG subunit